MWKTGRQIVLVYVLSKVGGSKSMCLFRGNAVKVGRMKETKRNYKSEKKKQLANA
jgi:hypothetical protein